MNEASNIIQNDTKIPITKIYSTNNNGTIIKCLKNEDVESTYKILKSKLNNKYEVKIQQNQKPIIKILGILNNMDKNELENDINERNFSTFQNKCKILHNFKYSNNMQGAIIEVTSDLHEYIVNNKYNIFIGCQSCKAYDDLNISQCFVCAGFNHSSKKCRNDKKCIYCAGNHRAMDCDINNKLQCTNCIHANIKYNCTYDIHHSASDTQSCQILQKKINVSISNTDYNVKPVISKHFAPQRSLNNENNRKRRRDSMEVIELVNTNTEEITTNNTQEPSNKTQKVNKEESKSKRTRQNKQN